MSFSYSGRGMFGKRCMAFRSMGELLEAIRANPALPTDGWTTDSLGMGVVIYNPSVPPSDDDEAT